MYNFGTKSVINYRGNQYQTTGLGHQIPWDGNPNIPTDWLAGANMIRSVGKTYWLGPVDNFADRDNNTKTLTIDHVFSPNLDGPSALGRQRYRSGHLLGRLLPARRLPRRRESPPARRQQQSQLPALLQRVGCGRQPVSAELPRRI